MSNLYGYIPKLSKPFSTSNIFTAEFNVPTAGKYDFSNVATNKQQKVFTLMNTSVYFISQLSFGATIPEGSFLSAIDISAQNNFPSWRLKLSSDNSFIHAYDYPTVIYFQDRYFETFIESKQLNDTLTIDFNGVLIQTADLIGVSTIRAQLSMTVYEITDSIWIKNFHDSSKKEFKKIG